LKQLINTYYPHFFPLSGKEINEDTGVINKSKNLKELTQIIDSIKNDCVTNNNNYKQRSDDKAIWKQMFSEHHSLYCLLKLNASNSLISTEEYICIEKQLYSSIHLCVDHVVISKNVLDKAYTKEHKELDVLMNSLKEMFSVRFKISIDFFNPTSTNISQKSDSMPTLCLRYLNINYNSLDSFICLFLSQFFSEEHESTKVLEQLTILTTHLNSYATLINKSSDETSRDGKTYEELNHLYGRIYKVNLDLVYLLTALSSEEEINEYYSNRQTGDLKEYIDSLKTNGASADIDASLDTITNVMNELFHLIPKDNSSDLIDDLNSASKKYKNQFFSTYPSQAAITGSQTSMSPFGK
jgi:hypothetical protein